MQGRSLALAERDWWTGARQHFSLELQVGRGGRGEVVTRKVTYLWPDPLTLTRLRR